MPRTRSWVLWFLNPTCKRAKPVVFHDAADQKYQYGIITTFVRAIVLQMRTGQGKKKLDIQVCISSVRHGKTYCFNGDAAVGESWGTSWQRKKFSFPILLTLWTQWVKLKSLRLREEPLLFSLHYTQRKGNKGGLESLIENNIDILSRSICRLCCRTWSPSLPSPAGRIHCLTSAFRLFYSNHCFSAQKTLRQRTVSSGSFWQWG